MMKVGFGEDCLPAVTLVSNEFIDRYMPSVNGEYVKVFLYLLRHLGEDITAGGIAEALELTEGDVRRALSRWEREKLISLAPDTGEAGMKAGEEAKHTVESALPSESRGREERIAGGDGAPNREAMSGEELPGEPSETLPSGEELSETLPSGEELSEALPSGEEPPGAPAASGNREPSAALPDKSAVDFSALRGSEEFTQLLYVIQRYLSKIFSQTDNETIAYLYDVLKLPADLLVCLAERCAQSGKTSLRYFESVALDWYRRGIRTAEQAEKSEKLYSSEVYAVMRAFGISGRNPGTEELKYIRKWYERSGFSRELILEACGRTLLRINKPSFPYADKILSEWKNAGVRTPEEAALAERKRGEERRNKAAGGGRGSAKGATRFNNFEQRDDDLDALALRMMKKKLAQS